MYLALCEIINRDVAQFGSALPWGGRGRRFKSCRSDFLLQKLISNWHNPENFV